ncbi:MAG: hypothetical protein DRQ13_00660 [Ignavibacteriae bacterium]|nr:MAG: hypothetical protein DRQ13_00660 [Ignavibacteriota bacterium]
MKTIKLIPMLLLFSFMLFAQSSDLKNEPGYVDFGDLSSFEGSTGVTEIILEEDLLSMLAQMSSEEDPNIMAILNGLKLVKANVFEVSQANLDELKSRIDQIDSKLTGSNWKRIVRTRSAEETANVYIKQNSNQIVGLAVTTLEADGEAAFVNIVGTIELATIGKLGNKFGIPHLNDVKKNNGDHDED